MIPKKIFKSFRKFEENLLNNPRFAFKVFAQFKKKKWQAFKKPLSFNKKTEDYIKISNFFTKDLFKKQKQKIINLNFKKQLILVNSLVETKFSKSHKEACFFIKRGLVFVNNKKILNPFFF